MVGEAKLFELLLNTLVILVIVFVPRTTCSKTTGEVGTRWIGASELSLMICLMRISLPYRRKPVCGSRAVGVAACEGGRAV
jgi:hypothetical protein